MNPTLSIQPPKRHVAIIVTLAAVILFLRKLDGAINPQLFAEDGNVFYVDAYEKGLAAIIIPYGGYLHLLPRLVARMALYFDPLWTPAIYNYATFLTQLGLITALFSSRICLPNKPALALMLALVPHTGEVFFSLTNINWTLAVGLVLLAIAKDAETWKQRIFDLAVVLICGLSGPFSVFLLPVYGFRVASRKTRESLVLFSALGATAGVQMFFLFTHRAEFVRHTPVDTLWLLSTMSARLYGTFWAGYRISAIGISAWWLSLGMILTMGLGYLAGRRGQWSYPRYIIAGSWLCVVLPVGVKFLREAFALAGPTQGDRYFFIPHVLMAWLIIIVIDELPGCIRLLPVAALVAAIIFNIPDLRSPPLHNYHWADYVQPLREGKEVHIPINPEGWGVNLAAKKPPS